MQIYHSQIVLLTNNSYKSSFEGALFIILDIFSKK